MGAPWDFLASAWRQRVLIRRLARREVEARYRGSILGLLWSCVMPLLMLGVYTFVFSVVLRGRWGIPGESRGQFALMLFAGMVLFAIFSECVNRAPGLMLENVSYVKKIVFPLEVMPCVVLLAALFNAAVSVLILLGFHLVVRGLPPATVVLLPVVVLPLILFALGLSWFLASVGVFLRDLRQVVGVATMMLLFLSPIFYPVTAVPEAFRAYIQANPMTWILEQSRQVLFWGQIPDWRSWALLLCASWAVAWLGYGWFIRTRKGFADVV
jgi:lipopolysaccharide transport system permease protein